ncbi:MAG: DUF6291 domain-containing protein [Bacteroidales bacterium]|nr:DUF6291 domain-containing protein [Bacteroidales bacterium]
MANDRFTFFRSFYEALKTMTPEERDDAVMALLRYVFDGREQKKPKRATTTLFLTLAKPVVDSRPRGGQPGNPGNPYGRNGRPKGEAGLPPEEEPDKTNKNESETNDADSLNENKTNKNESETKKTNSKEHGSMDIGYMDQDSGCVDQDARAGADADTRTHEPTAKNLDPYKIPPNLDDVMELAKRNRIGPQEAYRFFTHYSANGWMIGGAKVANWIAAFAKWVNNGKG